MTVNMEEVIRQMSANAEAIRALLQTVPDEQARWKPDPDTWSLMQVMEHIYNEERIDFRMHLKEVLHDPPLLWETFKPEMYVGVQSCQQALDDFLVERRDSLAWLKGLQAPDWDRVTEAPWRPLRAGEVLYSWVEHDFLHIRQLNELLYAWTEKQAAPYSVEYAGGW